MQLPYCPIIYTVQTSDNGNVNIWELLTLDGNTPRYTMWFVPKWDNPNESEIKQIYSAIKKQDWKIYVVHPIDENDILRFNITLSWFNMPNHAVILKNLITLGVES